MKFSISNSDCTRYCPDGLGDFAGFAAHYSAEPADSEELAGHIHTPAARSEHAGRYAVQRAPVPRMRVRRGRWHRRADFPAVVQLPRRTIPEPSSCI